MAGCFYYLFSVFILFYDARKLRNHNKVLYNKYIKDSPVIWSILSLIFYFVAAPLYIHRKNKFLRTLDSINYGDRNFNLFTDATSVVIIGFFITGLFSIIFSILSFKIDIFKDNLFQGVMISTILYISIIILAYYYSQIKRRLNFFEFITVRKGENFFLISILVPILISLCLAIINQLFHSLSAFSHTPFMNLIVMGASISRVILAISVIIVAPLFEEIIFRGYFFSVLEKIKGKKIAIFIISIMFTFMHFEQLRGNYYAIFLIFLCGAYLSLLRALSNSIIPSIVGHYSYNILIISIPIISLYISNPIHFKYKYSIFSNRMNLSEKEMILNESIKKYPRYTRAYNDLAWVYAENNVKLDRAIELIEKALAIKPNDLDYMNTKAEILYKLKRYNEAINIEKSLIESSPFSTFYKKQLQKFEKINE